MLSKAEAKYVRMSSSKIRLVIDLIKGKTVEEADAILDSVNKRAGRPLKKVVGSAFANLNYNKQEKFLSKDIVVSKVTADEGPMLVRYRAATMGRATPVRHRTSHIRVELDKAAAPVKKDKAKTKAKAKAKAKGE
jgi:large subunit ribosomal protein L22